MKTFEQEGKDYIQSLLTDDGEKTAPDWCFQYQDDDGCANEYLQGCAVGFLDGAKYADSQWRSFLEQEYSMKSYDDWLRDGFPERYLGHGLSCDYSADAWTFQDKQWRHVLANKMMALDLKNKKIEHLELVIKNLQASRQADEQLNEQRLKDAEEVIAFYSSNIVVVIGSDNEILEEDNERAREYQSKYLTALNS
jgi:hypothetical protein